MHGVAFQTTMPSFTHTRRCFSVFPDVDACSGGSKYSPLGYPHVRLNSYTELSDVSIDPTTVRSSDLAIDRPNDRAIYPHRATERLSDRYELEHSNLLFRPLHAQSCTNKHIIQRAGGMRGAIRIKPNNVRCPELAGLRSTCSKRASTLSFFCLLKFMLQTCSGEFCFCFVF